MRQNKMFNFKKIKKLESSLKIQIENNKLLNKRSQRIAEENRKMQEELVNARKTVNELVGELEKYMPKKANKK